MTGIILVKHDAVNSGDPIILNGVDVKYLWKNLSKAEPIPGKFAVPEMDTAGFEAPTITLGGIIDVNSDTTTKGYIKSLARIEFDGSSSGTNGAITLLVGTGDNSTNLAESISDSDTSFDVGSTENAPVVCLVLVEDEVMYLTGTTATSISVIRGMYGTTAVAHSDSAKVTYLATFNNADESDNVIYVTIKSFDIKSNTSIQEGAKWSYNITFQETGTE